MKLIDLIKTNDWPSLQNTLLKLYPNEETFMDEYKNVFEKLQSLEFIDMDLEIVITKIGDETDFYFDVAGYEINLGSMADSYSLAVKKWNESLGMEISKNTLIDFNELEIISHCLYEMTFFAYDEDEIQLQLESIQNLWRKNN